MKNIILRHKALSDLDNYFDLNKPSRAYHKFNGPYFKKQTEEELKAQIEKVRVRLKNGEKSENSLVIADEENNTLIGEVSWYWKSKETNWMEIGIVIFNEDYWGYGIGYKALVKWVNKLFNEKEEIVRLGLTTWSGNERMMKLAEKLDFICEATYRKARIVDGKYYDSVSYGILREEWQSSHVYRE